MSDVAYDRPAVGPVPLWLAFLGGPAMWTVHLLSSYPLVDPACAMGSTWLLNLITAVTALGAAAAGATGWWSHRRLRTRDDGGVDHAIGRARFMAVSGAVMGAFFTFVILVEGMPPVLQDPCARGLG